MPALLGRTRPNVPVLIRLRSSNFPVDVADTVPIADSVAGTVVPVPAPVRVLVVGEAAARARLMYGTRATVVAFLPPAWVTSVPSAVADTVPLADAVARQVSTPRAVADTVPLADAATAGVSLPRAVADTIPLADTVTGPAPAGAQPVILVVSGAAGRARQLYGTRGSVVAFLPPAWVTSVPAAVADTVPLADTVTRGATAAPRAVADTVPLADSVAGSAVPGQTPGRVLVVNQAALQRAALLLGRPNQFDLIPPAAVSTVPSSVGDTVPLGDTVARGASARPRTVADTVPLSDSAAAGSGNTRAVADTVPIGDAVARAGAGHPRAVADVVPLADVVSAGNGRAVADTVPLGDSPAAGGGARPRAAADVVPVADAVARAGGARPRAAADTVPLSDSVAALPSNTRGVADVVPLGDAVARAGTLQARAVTDTVPLADAVARTRHRHGHLHGRRGRRHHGGPGTRRHD